MSQVAIDVGTQGRPRRLAVLGGTGRTGRLVVQMASAQGLKVRVLARSAVNSEVMGKGVYTVVGDATDYPTVLKTIGGGTDAVVSTLGHGRGVPPDLETTALTNAVNAMKASGVRRLVVLASTVSLAQGDAPTVGQRLIRSLIGVFRRSIYEDALTKGPVVTNSGLDWTLVRASLLTNSPGRNYVVGRMGEVRGSRASRENVAKFMLKCVLEGSHIGETPYIADS